MHIHNDDPSYIWNKNRFDLNKSLSISHTYTFACFLLFTKKNNGKFNPAKLV